MENTGSVDVILDFLQKNGFSRAEAALRSELGNRPENNGFQKLTFEERERGKKTLEENVEKIPVRNQETGSWNSCEVSNELIIKEIECGTNSHGKKSKWNSTTSTAEHRTSGEAARVTDKNFSFSKGSDDPVLSLCTWKYTQNNGSGDPCKSSSSMITSGPHELQSSSSSNFRVSESTNIGKVGLQPDNDIAFPEKRLTWVSSSGASSTDIDCETNKPSDIEVVEKRKQIDSMKSKGSFADEMGSGNEEVPNSSLGQWNECTVKTVLSFSNMDFPTTSDSAVVSGTKEGPRKTDMIDIRASIKEQVDEVGRSLYLAKLHGICDKKDLDYSGFPLVSESQKEDYPRLPPVRLKSEDKPMSANWEERFDNNGPSLKLGSADSTYLLGSYLDVPVGQEISSSG